MRNLMIAAASAALALAMPLAANAQSAQPQPAPQAQDQQPQGQAGAPQVRKVNIIDLSELPAEAKPQVEAAASKASPEDLKGLRSAIDNSPEISKALGDKGAKSSDVIVANLDPQGLLTLVTKKRG